MKIRENTNNFATIPLRFRVWDKKNNRFVQWCGVVDLDLWLLADWMDTVNIVEFKEDFIISQDTGLKDKNGENIYIGDLLASVYSSGDSTVWEVTWDKHSASCGIHRISGPQHKGIYIDNTEFEIIGNVWQNPELLEEE